MQSRGHVATGGEQATEQELGKNERGEELDGLELSVRESAEEQAEGHAHQ